MALTTQRPSRGEQTRKRIMEDLSSAKSATRRLNAEIEETLYQRIKIRAAEEGRSISDITRKLWIEYLSK